MIDDDRDVSHRAGAAPNVVMIVLDDLGFADLGCYGSEIETPCIDRLADSGLRYNNFHVTAICSASRACLLTGRNHHAVGMGRLNHTQPSPGYSARIPPSAGTLPRHLREAGYSTLAVGKWHLAPINEMTPAGPFDRWPLGLGFERFYGFLRGLTDQWAPELVVDNGYVDSRHAVEDGYHLSEDLATQAIRLVQDQQQAAPDKPFFLYLATGAVHYPHQAPSTWIEPYRGRFDDGWDAVRQRTFCRQRELGLIPANAALTDRPPWVAAWDVLSAEERRLFARQMEVYAGFLAHTDAQIERLVTFLDHAGVLDNTLLMVLSDNGASPNGGPHGADTKAGMNRINDVTAMATRIDNLGGSKSHNCYAWGWAWAGNTPFRLWKTFTWLGGVRTPLIVRWPAGTDSEEHRSVRTQFCHAIDVMPTILDAAGVEAPAVLDGHSQQPFDGTSLLPTFGAAEHRTRRTQYFEMMGSRAIYHDGWKANTNHVTGIPVHRALIDGSESFADDRWSLFNTDHDFSESHDLAETHPERLRELIDQWWYEAGRNQVLPLTDIYPIGMSAAEAPPHWGRARHVYLPGGGPIHVPAPFATRFRLTAAVGVRDGDVPTGIIWAQGDWNGGWVLYVLDGTVRVAVVVADVLHRVSADGAVLSGEHEVAVTCAADPAEAAGSLVTVVFDGREVASAMLHTRGLRLADLGGKLLIGRDEGLPVCTDYRPPFAFTGLIHRVVFDVSPGDESDPHRAAHAT